MKMFKESWFKMICLTVMLVLVLQEVRVTSGYYYSSSNQSGNSRLSSGGYNHSPTAPTTTQHPHKHHNHHQQVVNKNSRFSHLDRLLNRLETPPKQDGRLSRYDEAMFPNRRTEFVATVAPVHLRAAAEHTRRHKPAEESYEEEEEDEDLEDEEDDEEDEEEEDDEEEDEEDEEPRRQSVQSDGRVSWDFQSRNAQFQGTQPQQTHTYTSFSDRKWSLLGNQQNLDMVRQNRLSLYRSPQQPSDQEIQVAVQHSLRVNKEGACKVPRPKVIAVKDVYPHTSKTYIPHCTILHQCGDDTGCCRSDTLACVPRKTHRVELYFYTTTLGVTSQRTTTVEKLAFYNHTECECQDKMADLMPRDMGARSLFRPQSSVLWGGNARFSEPAATTKNNCRCPTAYSTRTLPGGACACDCFDKQRECLRIKKGKEYFSHQDRLCIQNDSCLSPSCEFGAYLRRAGRCPRKREKFARWQRFSLHDDDGYK